MGFANIAALVDAELAGQVRYTSWRKTPSVVTAAGYWMDLAMSPGYPIPQYYASAPLARAALGYANDGGIAHGDALGSGQKYLRKLTALSTTAGAVPMHMTLCDYLLYVPFIDEATVDQEQPFTGAATTTRYTDGDGVRIMAVVVAGHTGTATTFTVRYTNEHGAQNHTTPVVKLNVGQFVNGTIITTAPATQQCNGPFLPLQQGDNGVRSIEGITMSGTGDVGLITLVLVKPLADISLRGIDAPVEVDYWIDRPTLPRVYDDAFLGFIALPAGSLSAAPIHGDATFVWST